MHELRTAAFRTVCNQFLPSKSVRARMKVLSVFASAVLGAVAAAAAGKQAICLPAKRLLEPISRCTAEVLAPHTRCCPTSFCSLNAAAPSAAELVKIRSLLEDAVIKSRVVPHAPLLDLDLVAEGVSAGANRTYRPVVLMHGLGDAGSNAGMQSLAQSVMKAYPGSYAVAVNVAGACARESRCG
jgi:hypothetical protein